jgi:hypothetical protein
VAVSRLDLAKSRSWTAFGFFFFLSDREEPAVEDTAEEEFFVDEPDGGLAEAELEAEGVSKDSNKDRRLALAEETWVCNVDTEDAAAGVVVVVKEVEAMEGACGPT